MTVLIIASKVEIVLRSMSIGLRFSSDFETISFVKNRAPICQNRATILGTLHLGSDVDEEIVLRFTASEYNFGGSKFFPIKAKLFSEVGVRKLGEKN